MLEIRPDDPRDLIHKNFFRYRSQIEQDFQRALRDLERNRLLATPEEQNENPEIGSVPQNPGLSPQPHPDPGPLLSNSDHRDPREARPQTAAPTALKSYGA